MTLHDPNFPPNLAIQPSSPLNRTPDIINFDQESGIKQFGIAGRVWEAAYTLAAYTTLSFSPANDLEPEYEFEPPCSLFSGDCAKSGSITLVEIGSGTGYAGIHIAHQLARLYRQKDNIQVVLSDLENVVPLLEQGIRGHTSIGVQVKAQALEWGNQSHTDELAKELKSRITHVVCSDLVYFPHLYPALLRTLLILTRAPFCDSLSSPEVIIGYKVRSLTKETPFWQVFGTWFTFAPVLARQTRRGEAEQVWCRFGHATDTYVFVATRRPESVQWDVPTNDSLLMNGFGPNRPRLDDTFENLILLGIDESE